MTTTAACCSSSLRRARTPWAHAAGTSSSCCSCWGWSAVSALVIASKETKLGLDLQGGLELIYEGQPTGTTTEVSGEDIEDSISIIEQRINELGVSEPEVARIGDTNISVALAGVTDTERAAEQVGTTAQLYFYDWEPNLIGPEKVIGGHPGQQPPQAALKASEKRWEEAGRNVKSFENEQLIFAGAYPNAYQAALLAAEQEPVEDCENCSVAKPRFYLFEKEEPHKLLAGPELKEKDLFVSPTGEKLPKDGEVIEVPAGTILVSELPTDESDKVDETAQPGWFAIKDNPALSGNDITDPKQEYGTTGEPNVTFGFTGAGEDAFHEVTRQIAQRGQAQAIGVPLGRTGGGALRPLRGRPRQRSQDAADHQLRRKPRRDRRPQRRPDLRRLLRRKRLEEAQDLATTLQIGALPINLKLISRRRSRRRSANRRSTTASRPESSASPSSSSSCSSTTASSG